MTDFTEVISSAGLEDSNTAVSGDCARTLIGLTCLKNEYDCLCQHTSESRVETRRSPRNEVITLVLYMTVIQGMTEHGAVMRGIELTGYKAQTEVRRDTELVTFDLRHPLNHDLKMYVNEHPRL